MKEHGLSFHQQIYCHQNLNKILRENKLMKQRPQSLIQPNFSSSLPTMVEFLNKLSKKSLQVRLLLKFNLTKHENKSKEMEKYSVMIYLTSQRKSLVV
jgi:hypothetical protein